MKRKNAFTLVELLVVITIIGILSSLITVAVGGARRAAKRATITMELSQISNALELYKGEFGEYPPDLADEAAVVRHVKKRWPRFSLATTATGTTTERQQYVAFMTAISHFYRGSNRVSLLNTYGFPVASTTRFLDDTDSQDYGDLQNDSVYIAAIPLWLGGFPNEDGVFKGFSADPTAPFGKFINGNNVAINDGQPLTAYYSGCSYDHLSIGQQDEKSVKIVMQIGKNVSFAASKNDAVFPYFVNEIRADLKVPYVYFKAKGAGDTTYANLIGTNQFEIKYYNFNGFFSNDPVWSELGAVTPYAQLGDPLNTPTAGKTTWVDPSKYQLIHPGLDGKFGTSVAVTGTNKYTISGSNPSQDLTLTHFRSLLTDAVGNTIGKDDFDNMTNFSGSNELKTLID